MINGDKKSGEIPSLPLEAPGGGAADTPIGARKKSGARAPTAAAAPGQQLVMDVLAGSRQAAKRGPGRPKGARNRRSEALSKWLMTQGYTHPAVRLAAIMDADTNDLARALGCKRIEAFQEQRKAASDLLPYFEGRILPRTDSGEQPLPHFHLHLGDDAVSLAGARPSGGAIMAGKKIEENQCVEYLEEVPSHENASHGECKSLKNNGN